ncbi:HAD family hydrolase [Rhodococcoides corynebacterioides]|uniref:HAD family hydrolase n=1 Tax=Rhodococcoides corynebacterioides TaxID=53972 RepID=UPI001C9A4A9A|nr:HAD family hydrolase [Rhodococcus corynebacterioides]MBY6352108.1 HAD family hydrolase [Rhodococcus corynebacterioides]
MTALVATDLDRTLIYSAGALAEGTAPASPTVCVEHLQGEPLSHMTVRATELLRALARMAVVLPTTTRTVDQFRRIDLPGAPWRYAVTSNGGTILADGEPDHAWRSGVDRAVRDSAASLTDLGAELDRLGTPDWILKRRTADDLFCYLVVDLAAMPSTFVQDWGHWCAERGWNVSQQGRKVYAMPDAVCKSRAVAEVRARLIADGTLPDTAPILAAGDGALDAEMLRAADAAIRPRHGELHALGWECPGLTVTTASGGGAAEEILQWFTNRIPTGAAT